MYYPSLARGSIAPPAPPPRDPRTTLSVGRARAKSMVAGLHDIGKCSFVYHQSYLLKLS